VSVESEDRVIALEGGRNFRDLGGYETTDGKRVRWRRLFRTGVMSYLTRNDYISLHALGIRVFCDFRTRREREVEPVEWRGDGVTRMEWDYDVQDRKLRLAVTAQDASPEATRLAMLGFYRRMPAIFEEPYRAVFAKLAAGELPLLFGCSAGKDRTGLAAALVLTCLGVRLEQVVADFVLTDRVVDLESVLLRNSGTSVGLGQRAHEYMLRLSPSVRAPMLKASQEYLEAAFDQIRQDHGSVERYARDRLGVTPEMMTSLREHLLEEGNFNAR